MNKSPNINYLWSQLIIEELIRNGVDYFCVAPGSRSAPLTVSVARNPKAKTFVHFDERGLGFHALGYVSATKKPCVIITTSGTAVANLLPAIIEASKKKLPLIVLSADRPPELRNTGADQTIDQVNIFGKYAKWFFDFPCPTTDIKPEVILTTIDQAVYQAKSGMAGVVHLNCMFREPLIPIETNENFTQYLKGLGAWGEGLEPWTTYVETKPKLNSLNLELLKSLSDIKQGLIVVGKIGGKEEQDIVLKLSERLNFPIFPDITSGLRLGNNHKNVIHYFDQLLLSDKLKKDFKPNTIIHLGGRMTSKRYYQFIDAVKPAQYISVLNHPLRNDPLHQVTLRFQTSVLDFCENVLAVSKARLDDVWVKRLKILSDKAHHTIEKEKALSEITIARTISKLIPKDSALFLASSMPIRDMDWYATNDGNPVVVGSNRGASGIDGIIATACGFANGLSGISGVSGKDRDPVTTNSTNPTKPTTLVIGDLAFLHDLNSLSMLKSLKSPFVIVVINNNGGGIFNFLPIAGYTDIFEKFFGTPHGLNFKEAARMFGIKHALVGNRHAYSQLSNVYKKAIKQKIPTIIEIKIDRSDNLKQHKKLQKVFNNTE